MEKERKPYYLGIDLSDDYAMISYYQLHMSEPDTVSTIAGSEIYHIPMLLARRKNLGLWYYGEEARRMAKSGEVVCVDLLLKRAVNAEVIGIGDESYGAADLLALFLRKVIELPLKLGNGGKIDRLVLTVERLNRENMEVFWRIAAGLKLTSEQFMVIDHKESFYYYALSQQEPLKLHDVYLFEYQGAAMAVYGLQRDLRTKPQVASIVESGSFELKEDLDREFLAIAQKSLEGRIVSAVYLVGDGFDGDWMKGSLAYLCRGRRVFLGKNLFSKGACYAAVARGMGDEWPYIYMGENEMKFNLSLKVRDRGSMAFYNLISAGRNWFEAKGECEVILSGTPSIDFWKQLPNSREAKVETLELTDLPKRPDRTSRIRVTAKPVADDKIEIELKDLGFGEFFRATNKVWRYTMSM